MKIKRALILAAGRGTRMGESERPKPLTPIWGATLLDFILNEIAQAGIEEIVINLHHKAEQIRAHLKHHAQAPRIKFSDESDLLRETGGGVKHALPLLGEAPFLVCNADILWQARAPVLPSFVAAFDENKMEAFLLLAAKKTALGFDRKKGDFLRTDDGALMRAQDTSDDARDDIFAGVQILTCGLFSDIGEDVFSLNKIYDKALARGTLYGTRLDGRFLHVGTPAARRAAENHRRN